MKRAFGRDYIADKRDKKFLVPKTYSKRMSRSWRLGPNTDQGYEPSCVGHAWFNFLTSSPIRQQPIRPSGIYELAKCYDEWEGNCVDMETLALCRGKGWVNANHLSVGDSILTFDIESEGTKWETVEKVHLHLNGEYRIWSNKSFQCAVTDNHRWPVRMRPNGSNFPRPFRMTTTSEWRQSDEIIRSAQMLQYPQETQSDDYVEIIGWVATEGCYRPEIRRGTGIVVTQKVEKQRVSELMSRLGVAPGYEKSDGTHCWEISGELSRRIRLDAPDRAPTMEFLSSLSRRQLLLFIEVVVKADGHETPASGNRIGAASFSQKRGPF